ncbi:MAG: RpiB/LacA/LacB family sugar-phosphate isomerase, partial [Oscillospiraceae bacterium]|nr:RpiB/LacA/LacB family sugar-phosphate isomerase [Oscillospiraceae bacterium]
MIAIGCDHAAITLKKAIMAHLDEQGIAYINLGKSPARLLSWFGYGLLALYIALLAGNLFYGCLFRFDGQGNYGEGPLRHLIFSPLVVLNVLMAVFAFVKARGSRGRTRRRNTVVFLFCLTM